MCVCVCVGGGGGREAGRSEPVTGTEKYINWTKQVKFRSCCAKKQLFLILFCPFFLVICVGHSVVYLIKGLVAQKTLNLCGEIQADIYTTVSLWYVNWFYLQCHPSQI